MYFLQSPFAFSLVLEKCTHDQAHIFTSSFNERFELALVIWVTQNTELKYMLFIEIYTAHFLPSNTFQHFYVSHRLEDFYLEHASIAVTFHIPLRSYQFIYNNTRVIFQSFFNHTYQYKEVAYIGSILLYKPIHLSAHKLVKAL